MYQDDHGAAPAQDHRGLNHYLEIFANDPMVGSGLPLWLPAGSVMRDELQRLARDLARADGCRGVHSLVLAKRGLFERSGHWAKFSDDMFTPMRVGGEELVLRPANCPHHALIYAAVRHSYRDLPIRLNELAPMFARRAVRRPCWAEPGAPDQPGRHPRFCRPDQVADEAARALRSTLLAQEILGLPVGYVRLSRRDASAAYLGSTEQWQHAEQALREVAKTVVLRAETRSASPRRARTRGNHRHRASTPADNAATA